MNIKIILEAKLKEKIWLEGVKEYLKRLSRRVEVVETSNIETYIENKKSFLITLEIEGKQLTSKEFAYKLRELECEGLSEVLFLIGGAEGLSQIVKDKSDFKFSLSNMTFLHQEAVLILIEQIYRAYKILNNEPYHR
ncbi:23S rRNA (pseudouridine(1915)-N(3))-methyltransferase RlmH [bacterium]|nr:23S rRNA (pseudouridine(1915)-N(3))-methyltransferase RlmH [bacterium]